MKASECPRSWSFWIWGFVFLFLAHALVVVWLADQRTIAPLWPQPKAFLYLGGDPPFDRRLGELTSGRDPTLFALPHSESFSGGAWLKFQTQPPRLTNGAAPPEWLPLPVAQLGAALDEYVLTNRHSAEPLLVSLRRPASQEVRLPDEPIVARSTVLIEGGLLQRGLVLVPTLPDLPHPDVLAATVVTIAVNGDGCVESAALVRDPGSKLAESNALALARSFEFAPLPIRDARIRAASPPTLGRLVFTWRVVPPTNAPAAPAAAGPPG
jgi:hypothetical protein